MASDTKSVSPKAASTKKKRGAITKRAKNQKTSKEGAIEILGKEKNGLPLKDLANKLFEGGYKTTSTNFSMALYQVLHNARNKGETFDVDAITGNWVLRNGGRALLWGACACQRIRHQLDMSDGLP